jgi:RHS repeat-associated protein
MLSLVPFQEISLEKFARHFARPDALHIARRISWAARYTNSIGHFTTAGSSVALRCFRSGAAGVLLLGVLLAFPASVWAASIAPIKGYKLIVSDPCQGWCEWKGVTPEDAVEARIASTYRDGNPNRYTTWCDPPNPGGYCYWRSQSGTVDYGRYGPWTGCPTGYTSSGGLCVASGADPLQNNGCPGKPTGNPCNPASGNKYQREVDYRGLGLEIVRHFNSVLPGEVEGIVIAPPQSVDLGRGSRWRLGFDRALVMYSATTGATALVARPDGRAFYFTLVGGVWQADGDVHDQLEQTPTGWIYTLADGSKETYENYIDAKGLADIKGRIVTESDRNGHTTTYHYDTLGHLINIVGPFGHAVVLGYDDGGRLASLTAPTNETITYAYDDDLVAPQGNLVRVNYPDGTATLYHYANSRFANQLTGISHVGTSGETTVFATFAYDTSGRAISTEHAGGAERFTLQYDSPTQTTVRDAANTTEIMTFATTLGVKSLVSNVNQGDSKTLQQTFDAQNNLTCKKDPDGRVTRYGYNLTNQRTSMTEGLAGDCANPQTTAATRTTTYQYLSAILNLPTLIESPSVSTGASKRTTITYTGNLPATITQSGYTPMGAAVSRSVTLGYNSFGQVTSINGPRTDVDDVTALTYNECTSGGGCGQLRSLTNAAGHVTTFDSYDAAGRLLQMTDPNGLVTTYQYDPRGRVRFVNQGGRTTEYRYNATGNVTFVSFPDGRALAYAYNAAQQLTRVTDNAGNRVDYAYDTRGNRTAENTYDASGTLVRQIDMVFDARNHLSNINAAGSLTQRIADALGNVLSTTDPKSNPPTQHQYDALSRLVQTVNALGGVTGYDYDPADHATQVATPNGAVTQYVYDDLGNLLEERSPDRGTTRYTHDAAGNVLTQTDARGTTATYSFDALNRVTSIRYSSTTTGGAFREDVTYTYDAGTDCTAGIGRLCAVVDGSGETRYGYDAFGNVLSKTHIELSRTYVTAYTYDAADRVTSMTYPDGRLVTYGRDSLGRISAINSTLNGTAQNLVSGRTYRPDGLLLAQNFGNGLTEARQYDLQGRLTYQSLGTADTRIYAYDANGNLTGKQTLPDVASYGYDALDRLTAETTLSGNDAFTYDANGNRLSGLLNNGNTQAYSYEGGSNRLSRRGNKTMTLDPAGNTLSDYAGRSYEYDAAGRLGTVTRDGVLRGTYTYNYLNQRSRKVKVTNTGATQRFVYHYDMQGNLIAETRPNGTLVRLYVWADGEPLAQIQNRPALATEELTYLHTDHLHTPRLATDATKSVVWRFESEAFGTGKPDTDPDGDDAATNVRLRFPGQYHDGESGLYYNWHRYYDPKIGRYITSDPIGLEGGLNTYAYAELNPLAVFDFEGLSGASGSWGSGGSAYDRKRGIPMPSPGVDRRLNCMVSCLGYPFTVTSTSEPTKGHKIGDVHMTGQAADIRYPGWPGPKWDPKPAGDILCCAGKCGFGYGQDEYRHPSQRGVHPHVHVQVPRGSRTGSRGDIPPNCTPGQCGASSSW